PRRVAYARIALISLIVAMLFLGGYWAARHWTSGKYIESVAVLPFENADATTEYLSDGITDDLITTLGRVTNLKVMARSAVFRYKGKNPDLQEVGRTLKIHALLTGRIVRTGDDVSIKAELTDVGNGRHLWGQQYHRTMSEVSAIEEDMSRDVLKVLKVQMNPGEEQHL